MVQQRVTEAAFGAMAGRHRRLPELSGGYAVDSIGVSNLLLFDVDENGIGTYQVQIQTKITKWRTT